VRGTPESTFQIKKLIARRVEQHCEFYNGCFTLQLPSSNLLPTGYRKHLIFYFDFHNNFSQMFLHLISEYLENLYIIPLMPSGNYIYHLL
jgi:hypothetical protein